MASSRHLALALLAGCGDPTVSSSSFMVGQLIDASDVPLKGVRVQSIEQGELTDDQGRFGVTIKAPDQYVSWQGRDTWYRREWQDADAGKVLRLKQPKLRDADLRCEVGCDVRLNWTLDTGLSATLTRRCEAGSGFSLPQIPAATPMATCGTGPGATPVELRDDGALIAILAPAVPVTLTLTASEGELSADCSVIVDGQPAIATGNTWTATARPSSRAHAVCAGRPSVPVATAAETALHWSPAGPSLFLPDAPEVSALLLLRRGADGWVLPVATSDEGGFAFPPLPAGDYVVILGDTPPLVLPPADATASRKVRFGPVSSGPRVGVLHLDRDQDGGALLVDD